MSFEEKAEEWSKGSKIDWDVRAWIQNSKSRFKENGNISILSILSALEAPQRALL